LRSDEEEDDRRRRRKEEEAGGGEGEETNIKSNNPHLTGGEKKTCKKHILVKIYVESYPSPSFSPFSPPE